MEDKVKNKLIADLQDNKELKNTINFEGTEDYNVNAVTADVARHTMADLKLEPSTDGRAAAIENNYQGMFDGSIDKAIKYVPSDGGTFTGPVQINVNNKSVDGVGEYEIINRGQMETVISQLDGAPLYTWDTRTDYKAVKNDKEEDYKLNTVIGSIEDLPIFEAYTEGKAHSKYVMPDSYDNAYIRYGDTWHDAYWNDAYSDIKNTITKLVFKGVDDQGNPIKVRGDSFYNMRGLTSVHLNDGVYELGTRAFSGCASLSSIALPDSIETIGASAFESCEALTGIVLGSKVTEIKTATFKLCKNLKSIVICGKITSIASDAFSGCDNLTKIYFNGTQAEWDAISNNPIKSSVNRTVIPIDGTAFPFLYICKDEDIIDTSLTSNKMFLKLPNKPLVEVSKGAARLERRDSKTSGNVDYFTYDVLAAVIAGINSRITALGSQALALPETLKVYDSETTAVVKIPTKIANESISTDSDKALLVEETVVPSVTDLAQDIDDLKVELLDGVAGNYATKTVGGISAGSQIDGNITVSGLLKTILGIKDGVAPSGFSFSIKSTNSNTNSITAPLDQTSEAITATWSVSNGGTYTGNYTPTIGGVTGTAAGKSGGTIDITVTFTGADTSQSISGSATYAAATGFDAGTLDGGSKKLTINRTCYYGPASAATLSSENRTSKNSWTVNQSTAINNDYFVIQYPKVWGKLSSITDNDTGYEAVANSETFNNTPTEVTKNGGTYYQYKTNNKLSGKLSFKINS